ncbi:hypothetical protein GALMADRAFT_140335 [Galerina marginata CBS 339.88]|uniref:Uncharacterized protein n=1 Tax=Galerina marginata (strain CBS 339.88) TaxID=685588 RepID=A0A067T065_GALM3|nr:hypothetical protein GALMADRAFT_140335 [Galerina marginata CBS 339.88]
MSVNQDDLHETPKAQVDSSAGESPEAMAILAEISNTMNELNGAFTMLNDCTDKFIGFPSQYETTQQEVEACSRKIDEHKRSTEEILSEIKSKLNEDINQEVATSVRSRMADMLRDEVGRQVKEQVDEQIKEHLPESLQQQADESKRQLEEIRISLQNSEARMANSFIQTNNLFDPLSPILTSKGEKSPYYPTNARCLFGYDLESAKGLNKDYELTESDDLQMNFKQFLKHIGTSIDVVVTETET